MGASYPKLGHGVFFKWTRLKRFIFMLPIHFFHCVDFKLWGFFPRLFSLLCIGCINSFLGCLVLYVSYLDWLLRCPSFFLPCLHFLVVYMCFFLGTLGCLSFILDHLGYEHKLHGFPCFFKGILGFFLGCLGFFISILGISLGCLSFFIGILGSFLGCLWFFISILRFKKKLPMFFHRHLKGFFEVAQAFS